jgi:serine/threonine-protein kinase mTOR
MLPAKQRLRCAWHQLQGTLTINSTYPVKIAEILLDRQGVQAPALIMPNLNVVQSKLVAKLVEARQRIAAREDGRSKTGHSMTDSILSVMGALASKVSIAFRTHVDEVLPLVVEAIADSRTHPKHLPMAVHCLGQIVGSTGCVVEPYRRFPALLPALLRVLDQEHGMHLHAKIVELLGIIGALDPHTHKLTQARASALPFCYVSLVAQLRKNCKSVIAPCAACGLSGRSLVAS